MFKHNTHRSLTPKNPCLYWVLLISSIQVAASDKAMLDENRPAGGTSIRYISSAAAGMYPSDPGYSFESNVLTGCQFSNSGLLETTENVDIPDGSRLVSITAFGEDPNTGWFGYTLKVDGQDVVNQATSGSSVGLQSIGEFFDFHIPYFSYQNQKVTVTLSQLGNGIELCGYRIGYIPPDVADDVIFTNNFYR